MAAVNEACAVLRFWRGLMAELSFREVNIMASEVIEVVNNIASAVESNRKNLDKRLDEFGERIEQIEADRDRPKGTGTKAQPSGLRVHKGAHGDVYELESKTRMQDVLPPEKAPEISLGRFLAAATLGEKCHDSEAVSYAKEMKQLTTGTSGLVIPAEYISEWIDLLRSQMVLNRAGMRTVTMDAKTQSSAALVTDPTASWHTEAGSINVGNPTFEGRTLTSKTIVARCQASVEVAQDSPDFGNQLANAMTRAIAHEIDHVGLLGSGAPPEPQGIYGASGITTVAAVGTPTDYSDLVGAVQKLLEANVGLDAATAYAIMSPRTWGVYENLATGITSDKSPLPRPRSLENTQFLVSTAVSNAIGSPPVSAIFLGDFRDLVMGVRREASVKVLEAQSYATNLVLEFIAHARADFMLARPASFCVLDEVS
jgi:HK97 family phage major capsid protein